MKNSKATQFQYLLLLSVFVVATCGLIYELIAGTLASYLLGDSVTQFSTIIGTYLFSMGIGSYLSKYFNRDLIKWFVQIEIMVGLVGGFSSSILYLVFEQVLYFRLILYSLVGLTGIFVGLEVPLLMRILKDRFEFSTLVANIFTFDYIGALLASLIFPLLLIPYLGIIKTSLIFGVLNILVAVIILIRFRSEIKHSRILLVQAVIGLSSLIAGLIGSEQILKLSEAQAYPGKIIYSKSSPYQRIVVTRDANVVRLYLNGNLQFSSSDEYRYHESLVHPAMGLGRTPNNVLILGGGDGLALREVLKYGSVEQVVMIDLDAEVTSLFRSHPLLVELNNHAFTSPKVKVINSDAFVWVKECTEVFDCIIVDFPDPSNYSLGKLYSSTFYNELKKLMLPESRVVIQSTSPYFARQSFWTIDETVRSCGFDTMPYHCYLPSFGEWGFILAAIKPIDRESLTFKNDLRFLDKESFNFLTHFPPDMSRVETQANTLNNQLLVHTFEKEWAKYIP